MKFRSSGNHFKKGLPVLLAFALWAVFNPVHAQFSVGGQFLLRSEFRNGYGKLIEENQRPAAFISQRARVHAKYDHEKVNFFVSIQDVRTWGGTPQVNETDNRLSVHEAYVALAIKEKWSVKIGRQELNYDNARFLGNFDWTIQARSHDFALVKFENENSKLHIGAGYNQAKETLTQQPYAVISQYKTAQMLHYENQWSGFRCSLLFWNNGIEEEDQGKLKIRYTQTFGFPTLLYRTGNLTFSGFYYAQVGRDTTGQKVNAHNSSEEISFKHTLDEKKQNGFQTTVGHEWLSGTPQQAVDNLNHSFNPYYGTNHARNGYMDFFYVGNRHINSVGLQDFFLRLRYNFSSSLFISANTHRFLAAADVYDNTLKLDRLLGTEFDFSAGVILNDVVSIQAGYSQMWATETMQVLQNVNNPATLQNWAYAMLLVRPINKVRFVGLLF